MNELMLQLRQRWQALEERERMTVTVGGIVVGIMLMVGLIIIPAINAYQRLQSAVPAMRAQLETMKAQQHEVRRLRSNQGRKTTGGSLLTVLEQSSQQHDIQSTVTSLTPRPNNSAAVNLKSVEFNKLVKWLAGLGSQYGLRVAEASIKKTEAPGLVDVQIVISEPG